MPDRRPFETIPPGTFNELVDAELARARAAHPGEQVNLHEGYSVLLEEVDEFWKQVKLRASKRDQANIRTELIQIAAMARRTAEDLGYVQKAPYVAENTPLTHIPDRSVIVHRLDARERESIIREAVDAMRDELARAARGIAQGVAA